MVWYQKFEYAISHWLQKATEHVIGCVLCGPGCFSLFRGSAILHPNVLETYSKEATEAHEVLQYDKGELYLSDMSSNTEDDIFTTCYISLM